MEQPTKDVVAVRQLEEAIRIYFQKRGRVPIHMLAAAARHVLADLAKHQGMTGLLDDPTLARVVRGGGGS